MRVLDRLAAQGVRAAGLCADSRALAPGDVFVAFPGARADGRRFIAAAAERHAAAVLWEEAGHTWDPACTLPNVPVCDLQALAGPLAHLVYDRPTETLQTIGVTGTNGKTSVSQWVAQAFAALGRPCAVIGTLGSGFPPQLVESLNTTPDAISLHRACAGFVRQGARAVAIEVSSIGLHQGRANGVHFAIAVLTNLTRDHLEYHGTMQAYAAAKAQLFRTPGLGAAVLNLDDALGTAIARDLRGTAVRRIGYTLRGAVAADTDSLLAAEDLAATPQGLAFVLVAPQGRVAVQVPLLGEFNVANLLAVVGVLLESGASLEQAAALLPRLTPPPGRMQLLGGDAQPLVVVDYAHTPDALEKVLTVLRETAQVRTGRLACVFGCGGERDPGKRPLMGEVAARLADRLVLTSDNPRGEDPQAILADIARAAPTARIVTDRAAAIRAAVATADAADVVLIAGKGHETYQEVAGVRLPFSDLDQAAAALRVRSARPASGAGLPPP